MGRAMLSAIMERGIAKAKDISVSDKNNARLEQLKGDFNVYIGGDNPEAAAGKDIIILAVKPQNLADVTAELGGKLIPNQLVLSIIAGKNIKSLQQGLGHKAVVRVMPNTPAQIGMGMSVWTAAVEVTPKQKAQVGAILRTMGEEIFMDDEAAIDMATAISGSGPAYVFLFMEALVNAATDIGLPADTARKLVLQTVLGSAGYARQSGEELARLREMVTSPGGTTAEALAVFETAQFRNIIKQAVTAAHKKAKQLGG